MGIEQLEMALRAAVPLSETSRQLRMSRGVFSAAGAHEILERHAQALQESGDSSVRWSNGATFIPGRFYFEPKRTDYAEAVKWDRQTVARDKSANGRVSRGIKISATPKGYIEVGYTQGSGLNTGSIRWGIVQATPEYEIAMKENKSVNLNDEVEIALKLAQPAPDVRGLIG